MDTPETAHKLTKTKIGWAAFLVACVLLATIALLAVVVVVRAILSGEM